MKKVFLGVVLGVCLLAGGLLAFSAVSDTGEPSILDAAKGQHTFFDSMIEETVDGVEAKALLHYKEGRDPAVSILVWNHRDEPVTVAVEGGMLALRGWRKSMMNLPNADDMFLMHELNLEPLSDGSYPDYAFEVPANGEGYQIMFRVDPYDEWERDWFLIYNGRWIVSGVDVDGHSMYFEPEIDIIE